MRKDRCTCVAADKDKETERERERNKDRERSIMCCEKKTGRQHENQHCREEEGGEAERVDGRRARERN